MGYVTRQSQNPGPRVSSQDRLNDATDLVSPLGGWRCHLVFISQVIAGGGKASPVLALANWSVGIIQSLLIKAEKLQVSKDLWQLFSSSLPSPCMP